MTATLKKQREKIAAKEVKPATPKAKTPFLEESGKGKGVLGTQRWRTVPSLPSRARCQKDVSWEEKEDGEAIIAEYRQQEQIARDNDLDSRQRELDNSNPLRQLTPVRKQQLRKEIETCDHEKFLERKML